jgi:tetratricopeptide (TPR) repeat protein
MYRFAILLLLVINLQPLCFASVKAWEGTISLPTYPWVDDINPKFFALENSIIYPYTMQDMVSTEKEDRTYQALFLENEYLKVTCLPELAGRIFSVLDKTTGEEMFHKNPVVKPGMISMRGAWFSGGIEWNTGPHGHSVTIVSPVNAALRENEDGSATLVISNTEKIFRTRWSVFLTLHPGTAYLDEQIQIYNPTDHIHPYYFWNCTAFYCLPGTRFIYPMTLGTDHNGTDFFSWPLHEGKDLTWLKNYDRPTSVFAYHCVFDFFGAYDTGLDRGIVQYANHGELMGKKAWTWGQSDDGIVSQRNLHDGDDQYIEVQSGPLLTQADYGLLHPRQSIQWQEWWYPVHGLVDGFEYATLQAAIQRLDRNGKLEFRLIPTAEYSQAEITIEQNGKTLHQQTADLSPESAFVITTDLDPSAEVDVKISDQHNRVLLSYHSPLPIPLQTPPDPDWKSTKPEAEMSVEEIHLKALLYDKQTDRPQAREWYEKAIAKDPAHVPSLKNLAVLDLEAGLYENAIRHLKTALERNPDDGLAWFFLGSACNQLGQSEEALECAYKAVRSLTHAGIGYDLAGRICMNKGQYADALVAFKKSLQENPTDQRTQDHLLLALYASGEQEPAKALAALRATDDPTYPLPHLVLAFLEQQELDECVSKITALLGEDSFEIVETSLVFANLGLIQEAYQILHQFTTSQKEHAVDPMPYYYLADFARQLNQPDKAVECIAIAEQTAGDTIHPSRLDAIAPLKHAIQTAQKHEISPARACLLLGTLYGGLGRLEEAEEYWTRAVELNPALSVAWRNLGLLAWKQKQNLQTAASRYQQAIQARPTDQTLYRDLALIYNQDQRRSDTIALLENMPPAKLRRTDVIEILAETYVEEKKYEEAITLLDNSFFSNWENRTVSRNVFARAHLELGKQHFEQGNYQAALNNFSASLTYPKHLGVGKSAHPAEAEPYYWLGMALQKLNRPDEAKAAWQKGAHSRPAQFRMMCEEKLDD